MAGVKTGRFWEVDEECKVLKEASMKCAENVYWTNELKVKGIRRNVKWWNGEVKNVITKRKTKPYRLWLQRKNGQNHESDRTAKPEVTTKANESRGRKMGAKLREKEITNKWDKEYI